MVAPREKSEVVCGAVVDGTPDCSSDDGDIKDELRGKLEVAGGIRV
jgi:hypothetical protein